MSPSIVTVSATLSERVSIAPPFDLTPMPGTIATSTAPKAPFFTSLYFPVGSFKSFKPKGEKNRL